MPAAVSQGFTGGATVCVDGRRHTSRRLWLPSCGHVKNCVDEVVSGDHYSSTTYALSVSGIPGGVRVARKAVDGSGFVIGAADRSDKWSACYLDSAQSSEDWVSVGDVVWAELERRSMRSGGPWALGGKRIPNWPSALI